MRSGLPQNEPHCPFGADLYAFLVRSVEFVWPFQRFMDEADDADRQYRNRHGPGGFLIDGGDPGPIEDPRERYLRHTIEKFNELYPECAHIESSFELVLMLEHVAPGANLDAEPVANPMAAALGDELVPRMLSSEFMTVRSNPAAARIEDWITVPDVALPTLEGAPCCVYELLISSYAEKINQLYAANQFNDARRVLPRFDVPSLEAFFRSKGHAREAEGIDRLRVQIEGLRDVCRLYGIALEVYNPRLLRVPALCCPGGAAEHKGITPSHLYVAVRDGHIYRLDQGLEHTPVKDALEIKHQAPPSATLYIPPQKEKRAPVFFINDLCELLALDLSSVPEGEMADIRMNESLESLLIMMRRHWSVTSDRLVWSGFGNSLVQVSLWVNKRLLRFSSPLAPGSLQLTTPQQCTSDYMHHHDELYDGLFYSLAQTRNLSHFNPRALTFLDVDNRAALKGHFGIEPVVREVWVEFVHRRDDGSDDGSDGGFDIFHSREGVRGAVVTDPEVLAVAKARARMWAGDPDGDGVALLNIGTPQWPVTTESDRTLDYASTLREISKWQIFSEGDEPVAYDNHALEDYTLYHVARSVPVDQLTPSQLALMNKPVIITCGAEYHRAAHLYKGVSDITHFMRPTFLQDNRCKKAVDRILGDDVLTRQHKKNLIVRTIGRWGKKENKRRETRVFTAPGEAKFFAREFGGGVWTHHYNFKRHGDGVGSTCDKLYVWEAKELSTRYTASLRIAQLQIYDRARTTLALATEELVKEGKTVVGFNTDAIYYLGSDTVTVNKEDCLGTIGLRTRTPKPPPSNELTVGPLRQPTVVIREPLQKVDHRLDNEMSCMEAVQLVKPVETKGEGLDLLILGDAPGAGKSTLARHTLKMLVSRYGPTLYVAPTNELVMRLRATGRRTNTAGKLDAEGLCAVTYDKLLGTRVGDAGETVDAVGAFSYTHGDKTLKLSDFRSFVFDEIYCLDSGKRSRLTRFVERARAEGKRLLATGDVHQLPPIEYNVNPRVEMKAMLEVWGRTLFPHAIVLETPKRVPVPQRARLLAMRDTLFNPDPDLSVREACRQVLQGFKYIDAADIPIEAQILTYENATRKALNSMQHYRTHEAEYAEGLHLIYANHTRKQGVHKLIKNFTYVVVALTGEKVKLAELGEPGVTFELSIGCVRSWFQYAHAKTGHSSQGATLDGDVVIADASHHFVSREWLWVVLTRGSDLNRVRILRSRERAVDMATLRARIRGHEAADRGAGHQGCDLTVDWVMETYRRQRGLCPLCNKHVSLPQVGINEGMASLSIDRRDSTLAHVKDNCWLTHRTCNVAHHNQPV